MKIYHKIENINGSNQILLYVEYPVEYEFSLDFESIKKNVKQVSDKIREYALKNLGGISDNTALLILNGVVIGTLTLTHLTTNLPNNKDNIEIATNIEETNISAEDSNTTLDDNTTVEEINELKEEKKEPEEQSNQTSNNDTNNIQTNSSKTLNTTTTTTNNTNNSANTNSNKPNTSGSTSSTTSNNNNNNSSTNSIPSSKTINVKLASGQVLNMSLEDYVVGVVGAEMPAEFQTEALKAQSVASRTYALKKTASGATISASISDQVFNTVDQLKQKWGSSFNKYYTKIQNAVKETKGQCLTYNGSYIEALFFSTSNGRTEDSVNVWGNSFPYLKSVESPWDTKVSGFSQSKSIPMNTISSKLGVNLTSVSEISINSKTVGDRVANVTFCGKSFTGVQVRTLLGLRSADFEVSQNGNNIVFTTKGYGHGVGMSQYGANEMAKSGYSYSQILKHYYTGVSLTTI